MHPGHAVDEDDCPGDGKCHGCMDWCDRCGDVGVGDGVCDNFECMQHRCIDCHNPLTHPEGEFNYDVCNEWMRWCFACWIKRGVEAVRERNPGDEIGTLEVLSRVVDRYRAA